MEQFASNNRNKLKVVGIGTQDNLSQAVDFYDDTLSPSDSITLLWDQSRQSWRSLGVFSQPSWMLLDANGEQLTGLRFGGIDERAVLNQIS